MSDLTIQRGGTREARELERQQLQRFANLVRDEQHWADILASAKTDSEREELNRVVGPMLPFRRALPCTSPDCDSGQPGAFRPVLEVRSPLDPTDVAWVPIERLTLCETCKGDARLEHFLTDDIWRQIVAAWQEPTIPPTRRLTTLTFDRVH